MIEPTELPGPYSRPEAEIYDVLRLIVGLTHHEVRHLALTRMGGTGRWKDVLWRAYRVEKGLWTEEVNACLAMSLHEDPNVVGDRILNYCWPDRSKVPPMPYTVATLAASQACSINGWGENQRQRMWKRVRRLLRAEQRSADETWKEKHLASYLRIRGLL